MANVARCGNGNGKHGKVWQGGRQKRQGREGCQPCPCGRTPEEPRVGESGGFGSICGWLGAGDAGWRRMNGTNLPHTRRAVKVSLTFYPATLAREGAVSGASCAESAFYRCLPWRCDIPRGNAGQRGKE